MDEKGTFLKFWEQESPATRKVISRIPRTDPITVQIPRRVRRAKLCGCSELLQGWQPAGCSRERRSICLPQMSPVPLSL